MKSLLRVLLFFSLLGHGVMAAAVTLKIATIVPDGTIWMEELRRGAEEIKQRTAGRVEFRFYPGGVMGNDKSVLRKIRVGQLHGGAITGGGLAEIDSDAQLFSLPFVFRSLAEVDYVRARMDAVLMERLAAQGFVAFGISEGGFAYLMSGHPLRTADELKQRKVWVPEGDVISRTAFETIGVYPIQLSLTDVLTGLQTGLIDTVASSPTGAIALQWHTRVKYVTDLPLLYLYGTVVVSRQAFERLSPADQVVVREVFTAVLTRLNIQNRRDNEQAREALRGQGIEFVTPLQGDASWQTVRDQTIDRLRHDRIIAPELLQTLQHHLDEYRR